MRKTPGIAVVCCTLLLFCLAAPVAAKEYSADRFDVAIRVLPDGSLDVTETVVFRFEEGTFREVFREIPLRHTDGIEVVRADMQGQTLPFGTEAGTVEVRQRNSRVRVVWRFGTLEGVTREFVLNYRVRGVVRQDDAADRLAWRATPGEHRYRIGSSTVRFDLPVAPAAAPKVTTRKTGTPQVTVSGNTVRIDTPGIQSNGWLETELAFPRRAVIDAPPAWQQQAARVRAQSTNWIIGAAVLGVAGLILLLAWRQGYDAPPREIEASWQTSVQTTPPDNEVAAVAGVLAANGRPGLEQAMAAVFSLADRGEIDITELPRGAFGQRDFRMTRRRGGHVALAGYERAALETIFKGPAADGATATLSQARSRLATGARGVAREMVRELQARGLLDESRRTLRRRYHVSAVWLLIASALAVAPAALLSSQFGGWPFLVPAAILVLALSSVLFASTVTPLSNEGVRRAHRWRRYKKHLTAVASGSGGLSVPAASLLPLAVALGLANAWGKYLKRQSHPVPAWFHALDGGHDHGAFPAMVVVGGAGSTSGGGGAGGGAAGGGASGAG